MLREFLYVDTEKVRSMLAQLEGGVEEESRRTERHDKRTEGGIKGVGLHQQAWGNEEYVNKSLGDTIFPVLEDILTAEGLLTDISDQVREEDVWDSGALADQYPPGSIVRITAPGALFDARYVAAVLRGFASSYSGLVDMGVMGEQAARAASNKKPGRPQVQSELKNLEDSIPDFVPLKDESGEITPKLVRAVVKLARGLFTPGLHLNLVPTDNDRIVIGSRLQEGRAYLDSDSEILFARYGVGFQEWTLVGSIGHYAKGEPAEDLPDLSLTEGNNVARGRTAQFINAFMNLIGGMGFADVPQFPGFSVVPFAVYRTIPRSALAENQLELEAPPQT